MERKKHFKVGTGDKMKILYFSLYWVFMHVLISKYTVALSYEHLNKYEWLYQFRNFEENGEIYRALNIKKWKDKVPDATTFFKKGVNKKKLELKRQEGLYILLMETKRGELSHWLQMIPAIFFFLYDNKIAIIMIIYAISFNIPFIMIQRYNRMRIMKISGQRE